MQTPLKLASKYPDVFNIVGTFDSVEAGLEGTKILQPELVFLDVKINNQTGFDYLKQIEHINFNVVFRSSRATRRSFLP